MNAALAFGASFPGVVYASSGTPYDRRRSHLSLSMLYSYQHHSAILGEHDCRHVQVWAMANGKDASTIPWQIMDFMVGYIAAGGGVLVLSHQAGVPDEVRRRLMALLRLHAKDRPAEQFRDGKFLALLETCR